MGRRGSWEAAPPPPPVAALKRGAVLHGQLGLSLLFGFPIDTCSTWYSNVFYVEYLFLRDERAQQDRRYLLHHLLYVHDVCTTALCHLHIPS